MLHAIAPLESLESLDALESSPASAPVREPSPDGVPSGDLPDRQRRVFDPGKAVVAVLRVTGPAGRTSAPASAPSNRLASMRDESPRLSRAGRIVAAVASVVVSTCLVSGVVASMRFLDDGPAAPVASPARV